MPTVISNSVYLRGIQRLNRERPQGSAPRPYAQVSIPAVDDIALSPRTRYITTEGRAIQPQHARIPCGDETIVDADIVLDGPSKGKRRKAASVRHVLASISADTQIEAAQHNIRAAGGGGWPACPPPAGFRVHHNLTHSS